MRVGDRVCWIREEEGKEFGTVRWIGVINYEEIAGVEFVSYCLLAIYCTIIIISSCKQVNT